MDPQEKLKWYYQPWVVILLLFLVLGPFGLPLVYKSPRFGKTGKIVLTLLMILYAGYLIWVSVKLIQAVSSEFTLLRPLLP